MEAKELSCKGFISNNHDLKAVCLCCRRYVKAHKDFSLG